MRFFLSFFLFLSALTLGTAHAQTTATLGERSIGTSCSNGSASADYDTLAQCSATSGTGTMQKAPLYIGSVTAPPYANITCDSTKAGMLQYTTASGLTFCNGTSWTALSGGSTGQLNKMIFTATGTFTFPAGTTTSTVYKITVVAGGGSGNVISSTAGGSGGGAGGACIKWLSGIAAGTTSAVTVGSGGAAINLYSTGAGNAGGASSFTGACSTTGGSGGSGLLGGAGGAGSSGDLNFSGGSGEALFSYTDGSSKGSGGASLFGGAGAGGTSSTRVAANAYGAGGAGGLYTGVSSGAGAQGVVIVEWVQ